MTDSTLNFNIKTATEQDIFHHLFTCKDNFIPALNETVNIKEYAKKITNKSITFEAWQDHALIGLVAAYFNNTETQMGYITNVSVIKEHKNKGIALKLLNNCIQYGRQNNFKEINLEVHKENLPAVNLYEKLKFSNAGYKNNYAFMKLQLLK